jgi:hypothetical protein
MSTGTAITMTETTFGAVAVRLSDNFWRPLPCHGKKPVMDQWNVLCQIPWDHSDLMDACQEFDHCACGIASTSTTAFIDVDVLNEDHVKQITVLADQHLGHTPLVRIGRSPKFVCIYRCAPSSLIRSRKLHPIEVMRASGQIIGFGVHEQTGQPYSWINGYSPLTLCADDPRIPLIDATQLHRFVSAALAICGRTHYPRDVRRGRTRGLQDEDIHQELRVLAVQLGFRRAAIKLLETAIDGSQRRHMTMFAVVSSAAGRGWGRSQVIELFEHFAGWSGVTEADFHRTLDGVCWRRS